MTKDTSVISIKTIIIDDNKQSRYLIKEILHSADDIVCCDEAETLEEAQTLLTKWHPDVVICDILLEEYRGESFLADITKLSHGAKVIILSAHSERQYADKCLHAGAKGYVCKDKAVRSLVPAIRDVHAGKMFVS